MIQVQIKTGERVTLQKGDRIAFSVHIAYRREYGNREILGFNDSGRPLVYFNSCKDFIVAPHEITKHYPKNPAPVATTPTKEETQQNNKPADNAGLSTEPAALVNRFKPQLDDQPTLF